MFRTSSSTRAFRVMRMRSSLSASSFSSSLVSTTPSVATLSRQQLIAPYSSIAAASIHTGVRRGGKVSRGSTASLINRFDPPPMIAANNSNNNIGLVRSVKKHKSTLSVEVVTDTTQQQQQQQQYQDPTKSNTNTNSNSVVGPTTTTTTVTTATAPHDLSITEPFPSLIITSDGNIEPQGTFAHAQAQFLDPDMELVAELRDALLKTNMGIVAHYYMDVELQGILQALKESHPTLQNRIGIADSLKMGDIAVEMCRGSSSDDGSSDDGSTNGVDHVVCLGVDFMAESVQAIMTKNGYGHVPVYRATAQAIGCSLAESAESTSYKAWLAKESQRAVDDGCNPLHVIYINTSLETKAVSSSLVPTITCTSSNVLQTLLQSASEIDNLRVLYGPDTYMGENLERLMSVILDSPEWTDTKIASELHPAHNNDTLRSLRDDLRVFPQGNCVVHHMFGRSVVDTVKRYYSEQPDTYVTAHLEVPGEMFDIAMTKSLDDKGVVGSTSDILTFITRKVQQAVTEEESSTTAPTTEHYPRRLRFVLGTEAGMVSSIVKNVKEVLKATGSRQVEAEIVFPVSSDAVMATGEGDELNGSDQMALVPGVAGGEGCSTAGGCATCPFMKMNDLDRLQDIIEMVDDGSDHSIKTLNKHLPPDRLTGQTISNVDAVELGTEAILFMRGFMQKKSMPEELVNKVTTFASAGNA